MHAATPVFFAGKINDKKTKSMETTDEYIDGVEAVEDVPKDSDP